MKYLPIFTEIKGRAALIVGGGSIALRKARLLIDAGADVTLISAVFVAELSVWAEQGKVKLVHDNFDARHLDRQLLVIAATDDEQVNRHVAQIAEGRNILVNVVDDPDNSSFIFPAIVDRSPIVLAISSGGSAPVLVRRLREKLEALLPQHLGALADLIGRYRDKAKRTFATINQRRNFWEKIVEGPVASLLAQKKNEEAEQLLQAEFDGHKADEGEVYIVGGGPGDPGLLTIKALQLMQQADVVVHDGLVSDEVMNLVRRDAERISVSKSAGNHSVPQDEINQILVDQARKGHKVCRLKGGDPFIFGRGGEECETLVENGIPFQIVPGITAAAGCSSYAGIPLTHRDYAQGVQFVTGHTRKGGKGPDWASLAKPNQTLVVYMGLINSGEIVKQLMTNGRNGSTPVALVERGTTDAQRVVTGRLDNLVELIQDNEVKSPALIIIGEVVALQQKLQWYGDAPGHNENIQAVQPLVQTDTRSAA